ncbi:hypothetical protein H6G89_32610 [Oscillatoria sp. FACHB-1407]|uniref:hypothetical protein n=1 Tax=Oscillatoria sp. FACHB-1407 TaxID=2692847 RepID=UPI0016862B8D|nr:hypothetical protein [Oscillatoria sp. FACHB-1407]MBD2465732.1 hypothetical protein [Oscillatoria sp. FACHB-1407]
MNQGFGNSPNGLSNVSNNGIEIRSDHNQTQGLNHSPNPNLNRHQTQGLSDSSNPNTNHNQSQGFSGNPNQEWGDRCGDSTDVFPSHASWKLDAAIALLIDKVSNFSDSHFDAGWMNLNEAELIELVALVIRHTTEHLNGQLLSGLLLHLRGQREAASPEPDPIPEAEGQQAQPNNPGG